MMIQIIEMNFRPWKISIESFDDEDDEKEVDEEEQHEGFDMEEENFSFMIILLSSLILKIFLKFFCKENAKMRRSLIVSDDRLQSNIITSLLLIVLVFGIKVFFGG